MTPFRPDRSRRGPDPLLGPKMLLFVAGAVLALIGMATDSMWLVMVAAAALAGGLVLRFLGRTRHDGELDPDELDELDEPDELDELDELERGTDSDADDASHADRRGRIDHDDARGAHGVDARARGHEPSSEPRRRTPED